MPNKRALQLGQYGISKNRERQLYYFCLQYNELIEEKEGLYSVGCATFDGMPHGNDISDPTARIAERAARLHRDIELIEQTAIEACGELYPWILKAVTEGKSWAAVSPPCCKNTFYDERRKFFGLLNLKK